MLEKPLQRLPDPAEKRLFEAHGIGARRVASTTLPATVAHVARSLSPSTITNRFGYLGSDRLANPVDIIGVHETLPFATSLRDMDVIMLGIGVNPEDERPLRLLAQRSSHSVGKVGCWVLVREREDVVPGEFALGHEHLEAVEIVVGRGNASPTRRTTPDDCRTYFTS